VRRSSWSRYAEAGVDRLVVTPWTRGSGVLSGLERFAGEVLSRLPNS
jgi:hypothetical protein